VEGEGRSNGCPGEIDLVKTQDPLKDQNQDPSDSAIEPSPARGLIEHSPEQDRLLSPSSESVDWSDRQFGE